MSGPYCQHGYRAGACVWCAADDRARAQTSLTPDPPPLPREPAPAPDPPARLFDAPRTIRGQTCLSLDDLA